MALDQQRSDSARMQRYDWRMGAFSAFAGVFGLYLLALVLTGQTWRAISYGVVALFAFLILLAAYFWGALVFGGLFEMLSQRRTPVPWELGDGQAADVPEHDIDPGLELLAAGMLVYRRDEAKPRAYFRAVPLADTRALRPFIVARTGADREHTFTFALSDERDIVQFSEAITFPVRDHPQAVMPPPYQLATDDPRMLAGRRWTLRVQSGVTVVTTFRFQFVGDGASGDPVDAMREQVTAQYPGALPQLLDDAVTRDAMTETRDVVVEVF